MAAYTELFMDQGADFTYTITLQNEITNAIINAYGSIFSSQMRRSHLTQNATSNIVCTITDASNGVVVLSLAAANTANIKGGRYMFDVNQTYNNISTRILEGMIIVSPRITR